jgi:hypothetical protein
VVLYVGLDLSRKRFDWDALLADGERVAAGHCAPDGDGLAHLVRRLASAEGPVLAAIESMTGARFVHDRLERAGRHVRIAGRAADQGFGAACLQDRSHRCLGVGRACPPRSCPGDSAARPRRLAAWAQNSRPATASRIRAILSASRTIRIDRDS